MLRVKREMMTRRGGVSIILGVTSVFSSGVFKYSVTSISVRDRRACDDSVKIGQIPGMVI